MLSLAAAPVSASFLGARATYTITRTSSGIVVTSAEGVSTMLPLSMPAIAFSDVTVNTQVAANARTIPAEQLQSIIELYVAYFNRLPDADGLDYWISQWKAGQSLEQIGASFYHAAVQFSSLTGYAATMSDADFVIKIYSNVLGRTPDQDGLKYWSEALAGGTETRGTLVRAILASAHTFKGDAIYGNVADLLDNKLDAAYHFAVRHGLSYNSASESISKTMALAAAVTSAGSAAAKSQLGVPGSAIAGFPAPTFVDGVRCEVTESVAGLTACLTKATLDGKPFQYNIGPAGAALDLDQDGRPDVVLSPNFNVRLATSTPVQTYRGLGNGADFRSMSLDLAGADASGTYVRSVITGDFDGDGQQDFYLAEANEIPAPDGQGPFKGSHQYAYLSQGSGKFKKIDLGLGDKTVHGADAGLVKKDGFSLALNTPWNKDRDTSHFSTVRFDAGGSVSATHYGWTPTTDSGTYSLVIDVNRDAINDVILLSRYTELKHRIMLNDGSGKLIYSASFNSFTSDSSRIQAENAVALDLNGDGYQDFVVQYIDRSGSPSKSHLRVYINTKAGSFTDETAQWLGTQFQDYSGSYFDLRAADVDADGKPDLLFTTQAIGDPPPGFVADASLVVLKNNGSQLSTTRFDSLAWKEPLIADQQWMPGSAVVVPVNGKPTVLISKQGSLYSVRFQ